MPYSKAVLVAISLLAMASPARAALIIDQTGPMTDLFRLYDSEFIFTAGDFGIVGPQTIGPPFSTPALFQPSGSPEPPWTFHGPLVHYEILLTTPTPLMNARGEDARGNYYDIYNLINGQWTYTGGNDNSGEFDLNCEGSCSPIPVTGNTAMLSFDAQNLATWDYGFGGYVVDWQWYNFAQIAGELPIEDLNGQYRLQVFASTVPEPQTWALMLLGFAGIGISLRRFQKAITA